MGEDEGEPTIQGGYEMKLAALIICIASVSCASKPDPAALFPISAESKDYQDGFRAGFYEGLTYNQITP